jgi:hypothetical protein
MCSSSRNGAASLYIEKSSMALCLGCDGIGGDCGLLGATEPCWPNTRPKCASPEAARALIERCVDVRRHHGGRYYRPALPESKNPVLCLVLRRGTARHRFNIEKSSMALCLGCDGIGGDCGLLGATEPCWPNARPKCASPEAARALIERCVDVRRHHGGRYYRPALPESKNPVLCLVRAGSLSSSGT